MSFLEKLARSAIYLAAAAPLFLASCNSPPTTARARWYWDKRQDLTSREYSTDKGEITFDRMIISASERLSRAMQPDYLPIDVSTLLPDKITTTEEKKKVGVIEIYQVDSRGNVVMFESYLTDFMIAAVMSEERLGENFAVMERYKLRTLLREIDANGTSDFDPREAIRSGRFKGVNAILTGNVYSSDPDPSNPKSRPSLKVILRIIDAESAAILGNATESIDVNPTIEDWLRKRGGQ